MHHLLSECKSALSILEQEADVLHREGKCGDFFMCQVSKLTHHFRQLVEYHQSLDTALIQWITDSMTLFTECEIVYRNIYLSVYTALDRKRYHANEQPPNLRPTGVPIDPNCALQITEHQQDTKIILYNDNESLFKFPHASPLNQFLVEQIENYYTEFCKKIASHTQLYLTLCQTEETLVSIMKEIYLIRLDLEKRLTKTEQFSNKVTTLNNLLSTRKMNCRVFTDNLMAKMTVVAQLKDNLLRTYYYTTTRNRHDRLQSIF